MKLIIYKKEKSTMIIKHYTLNVIFNVKKNNTQFHLLTKNTI